MKFQDQDEYVVASGISPSGIVHAGNFREIITSDFVAKSLKNRGEDVTFIYSWDDYDRFRKVPANVPDEWEQYLGLPLSKVPDPEGCHESYARHFESKLEKQLEGLHMDIEFVRQTEMFESGEYTELIKTAMDNREKIKSILDEYRREPLEEPYYPLRVYCEGCDRDFTEVTDYDGNYTVTYYCERCEEEKELNFKQHDSVKPPWRIDWPMRWKYEGVDFEPAGKEHSASGGSRDTGNELAQEVFDMEPPVHQMYEFVTKDGAKISSSNGENAFTIDTLKEIYSPEMIRFLFSNTKPSKSFEIPFESEEVFQRYDKFDTIESAYFNPDEVENEKKRKHWKRVYEMAVVDVPESQPVRFPFQHASFIAQTVPQDKWETKAIESLKSTGHVPQDIGETGVEQVLERLKLAKKWARKYAPEEYIYSINTEMPEKVLESLSEDEKDALKALADLLETKEFDSSDELDGEIFGVKEDTELGTGEFFTACYKAIFGREQGPRLSRLIMSIGQNETAQILRQVE